MNYYECHIVVRKGPYAFSCDAKPIGRAFGFWSSTIDKDDGGEEEEGDIFLTSRDTLESRMRTRMVDLCEALVTKSLRVHRYKIELTVLDSNISGTNLPFDIETQKVKT